MGKISNQYFEGGQAPTATQLNAVYNSFAGSKVDYVNLYTEWAQKKHFNTSKNIIQCITFDYDGTANWNTTS